MMPWFEWGVNLLRADPDGAYDSDTNDYTFYEQWKVVSHPEYNYFDLDNDIALIFLDEDLSNMDELETVQLPTSICDADSQEALQVLGYGTDTLQFADLICISHDECEDSFDNYINYVFNECYGIVNTSCLSNYDPDYDYDYDVPEGIQYYSDIYVSINEDSTQCAVGDDASPCFGDSGGPLIKTGTNIQYGITSWSIGCAPNAVPTIYVNTYNYKSWIEDTIESV